MNKKRQSPVKKVLIGLGVLFTVIILVLVSMFGYLGYIGRGMDRSSEQYVDEAVKIIGAEWDEQELEKRASPEFMNTVTDEELDKYAQYVDTHLGKLQEYIGAEGESQVFINNFRLEITASYIAQAKFEKGNAKIYITLVHRNDKWQIHRYKVTSDVFKPY